MHRPIELTVRVAMALILLGLAAGCGPAAQGAVLASDKPRLEPDVTRTELDELAVGNNAFAFDLYQRLRAKKDGNFFYSPYSISLALAMTYAGARGSTEEQMASTLHYTLPQARLHPAFNALDAILTSYGAGDEESRFQLRIANAIWGQAGFPFLPTFLDTLAENYGAGLRTLDFARDPERAREIINAWVSEQTEEKIENLIPEGVLDRLVRLVLTNAIYFNAKWALPFEVHNTHDAPFRLLDGSTVSVPTMSQVATFEYAEGEGYQAVELRYQGAPMSMLFILPAAGRFEELESALSAGWVESIVAGLSPRKVDLSVPTYTFESEFDLSQTLIEMGMPDAFSAGDRAADFSGMATKTDLFISAVVHKAFVAVDEEGTEAAAATAVIIKESEVIVEDAVEMRLDRPFLFLIRDTDTDTVLFAGRVLNPEA
jgi:serpin B